MVRIIPWLAATLATLAGCGGAERPSFAPSGPGGSTAGPREPARPSTEATIPQNIETH